MSRSAASIRRGLLAALALGPHAAAVIVEVPGDYPTIQDALSADIADLEEIIVAPGTYPEAIDFNGRAVTLRSSGGPHVTIIDATGLGDTVVRFQDGEGADSVLDGFTVTGGTGDDVIFAQSIGGGMVCLGSSSPTIRDCIFEDNTADFGGAAFIQNSSPTILHSRFDGNTAGIGLIDLGSGGALYLSFSSNPLISNCAFVGNTATTTTTSFGDGGALSIEAASAPVVINCTFFDNAADGDGGAVAADGDAATFVNCILWANSPDQVIGAPAITFSDVQGGFAGAGNLDADPAFLDAAHGSVRLTGASPCVDAGDNAAGAGVGVDLDGLARFVDGDGDTFEDVDMGAYEFPGARVHNVTRDLHYGYLQPAVDEAFAADEIVADPGTYREAIDLSGKAVTVRSAAGHDATTIDAAGLGDAAVRADSGEGPGTVLEGFTITGGTGDTSGAPSGGGMYIFGSGPTVTDCALLGNSARNGAGLYCNLGAPAITGCMFSGNATTGLGLGGGAYFGADSSATVTGCQFLGNDADDQGGACYVQGASNVAFTDCAFEANAASSGGAVFVLTSRPVFEGCSFDANAAQGQGGAVAIHDVITNPSFSSFSRCTFSGNGSNEGGAIYAEGSAHLLQDCAFSFNQAALGGALAHDGSRPDVRACSFTNNVAFGNGGAIANTDTAAGPLIVNCLFAEGVAGTNGGAIMNFGISAPEVIHCTFAFNHANGFGGGLSTNAASSPAVHNSIFWDNSDSTGVAPGAQIDDLFAVTTVTYSDVQGGWSGAGSNNIDLSPGFVAPGSGDLRLLAGSPCIDAADNTAVPGGVTTDLDGRPRFVDDPDTVDTGNPDGVNPISDMGAYEYDPCPADLDGDETVGINDFLALLGAWGPNPGHPADLDGDGVVGINDFLALLAAWGPCGP